jgi:hypothetical protein
MDPRCGELAHVMRLFHLLPFLLAMPSLSHGAVETFVETFDGNGPYESITNDLIGFDNPGWEVYSDDGFADGGLHLKNDGGYENTDSDILERTLSGVGSYRIRVELNDQDLGDFNEMDDAIDSNGHFSFRQRLHEDPQRGRNVISFTLAESWEEGPAWNLGFRSSGNSAGGDVPRGARVAVEITYDSVSSDVTFTYDNDTTDNVDPLHFGPLPYTGAIQETQLLTIIASSRSDGKFDGVLDFLSITPFSDIHGDLNGNGILDAADVDQLSEQVRTSTNDPLYDLNADSVVNDLDRQVWVHDLKQTYFGDADLNGMFDSTDLVQVLAFGEYEDEVAMNSTWLTGDWNGDGEFTSGDLVVALADGGYEAGTAAVPEPAGIWLASVAGLFVVIRRRGCSKTRCA